MIAQFDRGSARSVPECTAPNGLYKTALHSRSWVL